MKHYEVTDINGQVYEITARRYTYGTADSVIFYDSNAEPIDMFFTFNIIRLRRIT